MAAMMLAVCGLSTASLAGDRYGGSAPAKDARVDVAALAAPSLGGRWSGTPYAIRSDASRCGPEGCTLVLDIVPCDGGWCGIEVDQQSACTGERLKLATHKDPNRQAAFEGKLSLGQGAQDYVVEATFRPAGEGQPPRLYFIGDTGPELMMFRRSFPFHATLARVGEAVCKATDKPVS